MRWIDYGREVECGERMGLVVLCKMSFCHLSILGCDGRLMEIV